MKTDVENKKSQFYKGGESFAVDFCDYYFTHYMKWRLAFFTGNHMMVKILQ